MIPFLHGVFATNGGVASDFELIETQTVGAGGAASVTFSSIPGTYKHLQMRGILRTARASSSATVRMRINGDTGTNYANHQLNGNGTSASSGNTLTQTWSYVLDWAAYGSTATANVFGASVIDFLEYSSTSKNKTVRALTGRDANDTSGIVALYSTVWLSTAAITSISMQESGGENIAQFSTFSLYGVK